MKAVTKQYEWTDFLQFYSEQNTGRITRLGVFEDESGVFNDYWVEAGLPLTGIDFDGRNALPTIEIMLGDSFTHSVTDARNLKFHFNFDQNSDGFDVVGGDGRTTIVRFEDQL